jgi:hypothetical protein
VAGHVERLQDLSDTLDPTTGPSAERLNRFLALGASLGQSPDPVHQHMARTMTSFCTGLFAGGDEADLPMDNLDLERAFRLPKSHERHIHGHAHAGIRIVHRGPSLLPVLDAHRRHPHPFSQEELAPWLDARAPASQRECERRRRLMRLARSTRKRPVLLAELERRYRQAILADDLNASRVGQRTRPGFD